MEPSAATRRHPLRQVALYSLLLLLFFQLCSDFVEAIYVFGLLGTSIPVEIASVLLFLSPVILLLLPKGLAGWPLVVVGETMLVCRVAEALLDPRGKMLVAGLGVACFLLLFPSLLHNREDAEGEMSGRVLGLGLTTALALSGLLRAIGSGSDISAQGSTQAIGWILAIAAGVLLLTVRKRTPVSTAGDPARHRPLSAGRTAGLCLGLSGVLVLGYFALTSPTVIARWTGASYLLIVPLVAGMLCLTGLVLALRTGWLAALRPGPVLLWNVLFVVALVWTILGHQIRFPASPGGYPLAEPPVTLVQHIPLVLMLLLLPVIVVDWMLFVRALVAGRPSPRVLGLGFTLAALYVLFMVFAQIFTTVYDYIPVVGPFFRDRFDLVFLLAGLAVTLPVLLVGRGAVRSTGAAGEIRLAGALPVVLVLVAVATLAGAVVTAARPAAPAPGQRALKIFTYNIQQGYDSGGRRNYDGQLDILRAEDADIVGLQECDTARIANGNADVVRYFADRLHLHSYYGPKTVAGTFGIALLSKYPIDNPRTFYMYSKGEQTATIAAQITTGGKTFNVFVTHLGNGGPLVQQQAILQEVAGKENVILMGDFNFRPDTEQYRQTTAVLDDAWVLRWPEGNTGQGVEFARTIDHIFVSKGTRVPDCCYLPGPASDHPAQAAMIEW